MSSRINTTLYLYYSLGVFVCQYLLGKKQQKVVFIFCRAHGNRHMPIQSFRYAATKAAIPLTRNGMAIKIAKMMTIPIP